MDRQELSEGERLKGINEETREKILDYIKKHHQSENDVRSIAQALGRSISSIRWTICALEASGEVVKAERKYGNASVFVLK